MAATLLLVIGCTAHVTDPIMTGKEPASVRDIHSEYSLLGLWTLEFDTENLTAVAIPMRSTDAQYNVTKDIPPPKIIINSLDPVTNIIDVDATLTNPVAVGGYDVRGIIYTNDGFLLLNPDGWTDLFDMPGGDDINPFRAFAKDQPSRFVKGKSKHTEHFEIYLPGGSTAVRFAVIVSYPDNCDGPYDMGNFDQDFLIEPAGSEAEVWLDIFDWQDDIDWATLECPDILDQDYISLSKSDGNTWVGKITNMMPALPGKYEATVCAESGGEKLYYMIEIEVIESQNTIGLIRKSHNVFPGYTLFQPIGCFTAYLIDNNGYQVHKWVNDTFPNASVYFLENGNLLRTCAGQSGAGTGGPIQEVDWDGNVLWEYEITDPNHERHHDIERLPNGNTLIIAFDKKTATEAIAAGRTPAPLSDSWLYAESVIEVNHDNEIVWEWNMWDHMCSVNGGIANGKPVSTDVQDPSLLNINRTGGFTKKDWLHANAVDYNLELDQIVISSRNLSEIWVIDHSTANYDDPQAGIDEAAGPAGNILYRYGNPAIYGSGTPANRKFYGQHDCQWIESGCPDAGKILVFNNGDTRTPHYSSIDIITPPTNPDGTYVVPPHGTPFGPAQQDWIYTDNPITKFYSAVMSGATRLPNGNTLICEADSGRFFEIDPTGKIIWEYINPLSGNNPLKQGISGYNNMVFRCYRYSENFPGFAGHDMTPGEPIEIP
ncbi:MAG: aryl-sulfate sulfotransferase [bacterium]